MLRGRVWSVAGAVVMAVDGNSLVHRSYHAQAHTGQPSWAVRGLLTQLVAAVDRIRPAAVVVGFDDPDRSFRRERWPSYKANRVQKLETLVEQLTEAVQAMRELGIAVAVPPGLEADDVLASAASRARRAGARTVVVTSDRDAFALIDDHTHVLRIINGGVDASPVMTADRLTLLLGVGPAQYRDFAALRGDPSDNLPGVRGIGARIGARLLAVFGGAQAAFDDLDAVRAHLGPGVAKRLSAPGARAAWLLNCQVMAMHDDVDLDADVTGSTGSLPLAGDVVERVFRAHQLTWSTANAVRVLAELEAPVVEPHYANGPVDAGTGSGQPYDWARTAPPVRLPRLVPRRPASEQLSLF